MFTGSVLLPIKALILNLLSLSATLGALVAVVAFGLQRTGRIIIAAALLIAIVFASFSFTGVTNIKQLGFGVTFAILVDATIVCGLLVPAFMRIAGGANWWAPAWLRRIHNRVGLREE